MKLASAVLLCSTLVGGIWGQDPLVKTNKGLIRGTRVANENYSEFLGIPYALVDPQNPFGDSLPHPVFDEVFEAHDESPSCPQMGWGTNKNDEIEESLDCLTVNVYVPVSASSINKLPVMVWMYGGYFTDGSNSQDRYGPQYLVRHEVILVALNYRLGPYGFMCLDIPSVPGNAGLKDQQLALRWVQENIEAFGGNSSRITLFGQSAGAGSTEYHILNNNSIGLFNQAILQSATVFTDGIIEKSNPLAPFEIASYLGYQTDSVVDALNFLKNISTSEVVAAARKLEINFKPCIETSFEEVEGFMVTSPQKLLESKEYRGVPMIIGHTNSENFMLINQFDSEKDLISYIENVFYDILNLRFDYKSSLQLETAVQIVRDFYIGHEDIIAEDVYRLIDFESDFIYNHGVDQSIMYHLTNSNNPIYQYVFGYGSSLNKDPRAAAHSDDLVYIFKKRGSEVNAEDQLVIDRVTTMWANFAKYGDPTPEVTELLPVRWPTVTKSSRDYLLIDSQLTVDQRPFHKRMAFWDLFYVVYGEYFWLAQ